MSGSAYETGTGRNFATLANAVSDAIHAALRRGMGVDEAACCVAAVAADHAREAYGNGYLPGLAEVVVRRGDEPVST